MKITNLISNSLNLRSQQFAQEILTGLLSRPKFISSKYFYDTNGSNLFQKITQTKDYYLSSCELNILENNKILISRILNNKNLDIIELGVGDGHKSSLLINAFLQSRILINYYPIDISKRAMILLQNNLSNNFNTHGIVADYIDGLAYVNNLSQNPKLLLFLGSSIGNFTPEKAQEFLRLISSNLNQGDHFLIGFDLKKDLNILHKAYNDREGLTREFNLNILSRVNKSLNANFVLENFEHYGFYNPNYGAMESFIISLRDQEINLEDFKTKISFQKFEPVHLEYSFKYSLSDIKALGEQSGFEIIENFCDNKNYFASSLWRVK